MSLFAAALATLFSASAAHAQYRGYQFGYGGVSGYQSGYGLYPAARPSYQYGGASPFLWYSPHEGYSYDYQNGLPWRKNTPAGPIGRPGNSGVVRYSRPPHEPNESYFVRTKNDDPKAVAEGKTDGKTTQPATAEQGEAATAPEKLPTKTAATRRATASKTPRPSSYSASSIRANGGGDWVPNVPSRY